jgi:sn-glycerol 3-phosphate transport system permease protein
VPVPGPTPVSTRWRHTREYLTFIALVLPNVALIITFTYRPLIQNIWYSTYRWTLGSKTATQIGLDNYRQFFDTGGATQIFKTTAIFAVATVGISMVLGLFIALALNRKIRGAGFAQATVFSPYVLSGVGVGLMWLYIFDPQVGALAQLMRPLGFDSPKWFTDNTLSLVMVIIVYVWKNMGYAAVIYLAGLQAIPVDVLEAAALDGATGFRKLWSITLPMLGPTTFFLLLTSVLNSLQAFDLIRTMTPLGRGTTTLIYEAYLQAFEKQNQAGYSAAVSTVLFAILVVLTLIQLALIEKRVFYR